MCHDRHKLAIVHVEEAQRARMQSQPVLMALAHLFVDEEPLEDFGALVASPKTSVIPTASVLESVCGSAFSATLLTDTRINEYLADADRKSLRSRAQIELQDSVKRKWVKLDVSNSGSS